MVITMVMIDSKTLTAELEHAISKGDRLLGIGEYDSAIIYFNHLKNYFKDPLEINIIDIEIAWCYEGKGQYQEAQEEFLGLLENLILLTDTKYDHTDVQKTIVSTYHGLTRVDTRLENIESAFIWAQKAVVESIVIKDPILIASSNYYLALVHYFTGQFDSIFELLDKSIDVIKDSSDQNMLGKMLMLYAIAYQMTGDLDASIKFFDQALKIFENLFDFGNMSTCLNNMAVVYRFKGEYQISLRLLKKVEVIAEDQGRWLVAYHVVDNITEILLLTGEISAARQSAQKLVQMARENHYQNLIGKALGIQAQIEQHTNLQVAKDMFEEAIILLQSTEIEVDLIECVNRYLKFLIKIEDYDNALQFLNKYDKIIEEKQYYLYKSDFLLNRGLIESNKNLNLGLAYEYYKKSLDNANISQMFSSKIKSYIYLAENELERYQIRPNQQYLIQANDNINKGYNLALTKNLFPDIASINLLRSLLAQLNGEISAALEIITQTLALTRNKGLKLQEAQAKAIQTKLKELMFNKQINIKDKNQILPEFDSTRAVISTIRIFYHEDFSHIMPSESQLSIVVFSLTDSGPISKTEDFSRIAKINYDLSQHSIEEIILLMGSSFSIAVGQGNNYQEGLFGPLPVPRIQNEYALVYSKNIQSNEKSVEKNQVSTHQQFTFLCLIYPKEFDVLFFDRDLLKDEFSFFIDQLCKSTETINLSKWKNQLFRAVQTQYMSHT